MQIGFRTLLAYVCAVACAEANGSGRDSHSYTPDNIYDTDAGTDTDADVDADGDTDADADGDADGDSDTDTDSDADTDTDSDTDTDADSDADTDADSDADTDTGGTTELARDNGSDSATFAGWRRAVWFEMPFNGKIVTARVLLAGTSGYDAPFDVTFVPRSGGDPDMGNAFGSLNYAGGEAAGSGWLDVDVSGLNVVLTIGQQFFFVYDTSSYSVGVPEIRVANSDNQYSLWGDNWESSGKAFMLRVVVQEN